MLGAGGSDDVDTVLAQIKEDTRNDPEFSDASDVDALGQAKKPEWVLFGEIVSIESREGRRTQYDYAVNLRLLSVRDGAAFGKTKLSLPNSLKKDFLAGNSVPSLARPPRPLGAAVLCSSPCLLWRCRC